MPLVHTEVMTGKNAKRILPGVVNKDKFSQLLKRDTFLMQFVPAALVFLALLAVALGSWQNSVRSRDAQYDKAIEQRVTVASDRLEERMNTSGTLLRAGNGLLYGSQAVAEDEWQRFYEQLSGDEQFVGASIVGYIPVVSISERAAIDNYFQSVGRTERIVTSGALDTIAPVLYATKLDDSAMKIHYGADFYDIEQYRAAMYAARDSGSIRMTELLSQGDGPLDGVTLFMPVYDKALPTQTVAERQAAIVGYVYERIDIQELFSSLVDGADNSFGFVATHIQSNRKPTVLYQSENYKSLFAKDEPVDSVVLNEYGNVWKINYYSNDAIVASSDRTKPGEILLIGIGLAVIASVLVYMLLKYRTKIFALAEEQKLQQAKDELLSLASHQLRTPATGVKQYVGMVLDGFGGPVPKEQAKLLEQAYKSNERQLQIINEFLYVAKLGSGSLITTKHKFDLAPLVRDVIAEMDMDVKERHHSIKTKIPKSVPIKADEHSVRMIIENLLSNAIKYTQPGGKIAVELKQSTREAVIVVKDNGVGISKRDQKLLFKQFSRIPNELTNEVSGSGIGLYLAQQLAVRNGGKITVESEPARGSTFTLTLPNWRVKKITMTRRGA